jgi:hypothetical protein
MMSQTIYQLRNRLITDLPFEVQIEDIAWQRRVIPLSRSAHVRGWHPVRPDHPPVPFESKIEARLISELASFPELVRIQAQPVTVFYRYSGKGYRYTPDFLVTLSSVPHQLVTLGFGLETFIEVKPLRHAVTSEAKLSRQFNVLRQALQHQVVLVTDWDLKPRLREVMHGA